MNYLDASMIVDNYTKAIANPLNSHYGLRRSCLSCDPDQLLQAFMLFDAHLMLWRNYDEERYRLFRLLYYHLSRIEDDEKIDEICECENIINDKSLLGKWRNKKTYPIIEARLTELTMKMFSERRERDNVIMMKVNDFFQKIERYSDRIQDELRATSGKIIEDALRADIVRNYYKKVCDTIGNEYDIGDCCLFYPIKVLQEHAHNTDMPILYQKCKPYQKYLESPFEI